MNYNLHIKLSIFYQEENMLETLKKYKNVHQVGKYVNRILILIFKMFVNRSMQERWRKEEKENKVLKVREIEKERQTDRQTELTPTDEETTKER